MLCKCIFSFSIKYPTLATNCTILNTIKILPEGCNGNFPKPSRGLWFAKIEQKAFTFFLTWTHDLGMQLASAHVTSHWLDYTTFRLPFSLYWMYSITACTVLGKHHFKSKYSSHQYSLMLEVSQFSNWGEWQLMLQNPHIHFLKRTAGSDTWKSHFYSQNLVTTVKLINYCMTKQHTKEIRPNDIMALYGLLWYLSLIPQLGIVLPSFESDFSAF